MKLIDLASRLACVGEVGGEWFSAKAGCGMRGRRIGRFIRAILEGLLDGDDLQQVWVPPQPLLLPVSLWFIFSALLNVGGGSMRRSHMSSRRKQGLQIPFSLTAHRALPPAGFSMHPPASVLSKERGELADGAGGKEAIMQP